jgi:cobalt-precorrin 5A hydrolase
MDTENKIAIYTLNKQGYNIARKIAKIYYSSSIFLKKDIAPASLYKDINCFSTLKEVIKENFSLYNAHIFICAIGIVVRVICPFICSKDKDPAVVVIDPAGRFVISLLSGHLGGANKLTRNIARIIGATEVITTATDSFNLPAIDEIAREKNLKIDDIKKIKTVNSAILKNTPIWVYDPLNILNLHNYFPDDYPIIHIEDVSNIPEQEIGIICDFREHILDDKKIILYPKVLYVGVGCNTNTSSDEIFSLMQRVFLEENLSISSIKAIVTTDKKVAEKGIIKVAEMLGTELLFVKHEKLNLVDVPNPSEQVKKYMGVYSVCEAAAKIASRGTLIKQKTKSKNATIAVAISGLDL